MSEVKYEEPEHFKVFCQEKKYIEDSNGISLTCDLSKLIGFHKIKKWEEEKEIRLITFAPHKRQEDYYKLSKTEFRIESNRNRIARYIDFPIWTDLESSQGSDATNSSEYKIASHLFNDDSKPKIQITKIIFGENCGIEPDDFGRFKTAINDIILFNYDYRIEIDNNFFSL